MLIIKFDDWTFEPRPKWLTGILGVGPNGHLLLQRNRNKTWPYASAVVNSAVTTDKELHSHQFLLADDKHSVKCVFYDIVRIRASFLLSLTFMEFLPKIRHSIFTHENMYSETCRVRSPALYYHFIIFYVNP